VAGSPSRPVPTCALAVPRRGRGGGTRTTEAAAEEPPATGHAAAARGTRPGSPGGRVCGPGRASLRRASEQGAQRGPLRPGAAQRGSRGPRAGRPPPDRLRWGGAAVRLEPGAGLEGDFWRPCGAALGRASRTDFTRGEEEEEEEQAESTAAGACGGAQGGARQLGSSEPAQVCVCVCVCCVPAVALLGQPTRVTEDAGGGRRGGRGYGQM
jgi:hypothetical protein